jgi:deazaflavin-dependent oxidoreductase (nitroreductase family)
MTDMTDVYQANVSGRVALYEATDGREGGTLDGRPVVILTTIGAKSGNNRKNPVMRIKSGATYVAVASDGGGARNPAWYHNPLRAPRGIAAGRRRPGDSRDGAAAHQTLTA